MKQWHCFFIYTTPTNDTVTPSSFLSADTEAGEDSVREPLSVGDCVQDWA